MLLLAAQTAQTDFPLEVPRIPEQFLSARNWRHGMEADAPPAGIGGHEGLYNPRATILLGGLTSLSCIFPDESRHRGHVRPGRHAYNDHCYSKLPAPQVRAHRFSFVTALAFIIMVGMLFNVLFSKFFEGLVHSRAACFVSAPVHSVDAIYKIWIEKMSLVPLTCSRYPAFQN